MKSSSRFFLKPDIGEVFDQMSAEDCAATRAIYTDVDSAESVGDDEGEHFILEATLFK